MEPATVAKASAIKMAGDASLFLATLQFKNS